MIGIHPDATRTYTRQPQPKSALVPAGSTPTYLRVHPRLSASVGLRKQSQLRETRAHERTHNSARSFGHAIVKLPHYICAICGSSQSLLHISCFLGASSPLRRAAGPASNCTSLFGVQGGALSRSDRSSLVDSRHCRTRRIEI